jgi:hypothetical protein
VSDFGFPQSWPGVCARHPDGRTSCTEIRLVSRGACLLWTDEQRKSCLFQRLVFNDFPRPASEAGPIDFGALPQAFRDQPRCNLQAGRVLCEGSNKEGALGDPARAEGDTSAAPVPGLADVVSLSTWGGRTCAARADGTVVCWGRNVDRELVVAPDRERCPGSSGTPVPCNRAPTPLPVTGVVEVVVAASRIYCVTRGGPVLVSCAPASGPACTPGTLARLEGMPPAARLVAGRQPPYVVCALGWSGQVTCYGRGADLGDSAVLASRTPVRIPDVSGAVEVEVHVTGACARLESGQVTCWGEEEAPRGLNNIVGLGQPCALAGDGRVFCWGANAFGEMGLGKKGRANLARDPDLAGDPLPVPGLRDIQALSSARSTTCALDGHGVVRCWGPGGPRPPALAPARIADLPPAQEVWTGRDRQCALARGDQTVWCWSPKSKPAPLPALGKIAHLPSHGPGAEGEAELCAIGTDGDVRCVGTPAALDGLTGVRQISLARDRPTSISRGCAVLGNGDLRCWGPGHCASGSALCAGEGQVWNHAERVLDNVKQASVGAFLSCAVRADGTVWCWGSGEQGGLGGPFPPVERVATVDLAGP